MVDPILVNTGLLLHSIIGLKYPYPVLYINYSNLARSMICAIEELPRVEKVKVVLAMCLNEGQGVQEWEWQEPRPSGPKAESWTQALYSAPVLAGAACRHFLELLHFPGLSSTCFISFSRFKDVQLFAA